MLTDTTLAATASDRPTQPNASARGRASHGWVVLLLASLLLTGCGPLRNWVNNGFKVGPNYGRPVAPVADHWIDEHDERIRTELPDNPMWWEVFEDPTMNELIAAMHEQNLTLQTAGMRVLQARALRGVAVGGLFPQSQQANGSYRRDQISTTTNGLGQLIGSGLPIKRDFDTWSAGIDAYWEFDVWGRFRRNIEAADAEWNATIEDYDAILVALLAETAATYVELRTGQLQLAYARSNVEIQTGSLGIAQAQFDAGRVSELDVTQARANLKNTEQLVPLFEARVRNSNLRLCTLLGVPPRDLLEELGPGEIPAVQPDVAVGIPANLLRRRPDVRAAERRVAAQSARIGVAAAELYPQFGVTGNIRVDSERFKDMFSQASTAGIVSPGFRWDILNYGRLINNVRAQDAKFQELAIQYQQSVLLANEEVESGIVNFLTSQQRLKATEEAVVASERSVEIALLQYRAGAADFNRVFNLQTLLVQDQDRLARVRGDVALNLISIYKALGGGWEIRNGYEPPATPSNPVPTPAAPIRDEALEAPRPTL